jgi:hypothetical protein
LDRRECVAIAASIAVTIIVVSAAWASGSKVTMSA